MSNEAVGCVEGKGVKPGDRTYGSTGDGGVRLPMPIDDEYEISRLLADLIEHAGACECLTCEGLRGWAAEIEATRVITDAPLFVLADCCCRGCMFTRRTLWQGNPELN